MKPYHYVGREERLAHQVHAQPLCFGLDDDDVVVLSFDLLFLGQALLVAPNDNAIDESLSARLGPANGQELFDKRTTDLIPVPSCHPRFVLAHRGIQPFYWPTSAALGR